MQVAARIENSGYSDDNLAVVRICRLEQERVRYQGKLGL